jgi:hypothetical protein
MSEGTIRQWCKMFKDGLANKCSRWRAMWLAICWPSCSKCWPKKNLKDGASQFQNFHVNLHKFHTFLYEIITVRLGCFPKMLTGVHTMQRMAWLWLFRVIPQRWRRISQSHCTSNGWWNLGFIHECWNQRAVQALDAHTFTKQADKV